MRLLIQIPCYNEEQTLSGLIDDIRHTMKSLTTKNFLYDILLINDWSTDASSTIARKHNTELLERSHNKWLAYAFTQWVQYAIDHQYDILVNIDGDHQYPAHYIPDLIQPIIAGQADLVIGDRNPHRAKQFSPIKRLLQKIGNYFVGMVVWHHVRDAVSWMRAYRRDLFVKLSLTSVFSYTLDTLIQTYKKKYRVERLSIDTNQVDRSSRLSRTLWGFIKKSVADILRAYTIYEPFKIFLLLSAPFLLIWWVGIVRFLYFYTVLNDWSGRVQSLIISWILIQIGFTFFSLWIIGDLIKKNRQLIELVRNKQQDDLSNKITTHEKK